MGFSTRCEGLGQDMTQKRMISPKKHCSSFGLEQTCRSCNELFAICSRCWRRQRYCSDVCRGEGYDRVRNSARKKHAMSAPGRENHRRRQRQYRLRLSQKKNQAEKTVTDQSSREATTRLQRPPMGHCLICIKKIDLLFGNENEFYLERRHRIRSKNV